MPKLILHEYANSGNCYKIRLLLAHLGLPYERREYDIMAGGTRTEDFLTNVNANGRIPVLQIDDRFLPESNAALYYLAKGTRFFLDGNWEGAEVLKWMFFEQYNHEPNVATMRFWKAFVGLDNLTDTQKLLVPVKEAAGDAALRLMDEHLEGRQFFAGDTMTIADIALYAYTHVADEGGFDLRSYPNVSAWVSAIALQPGHVAIDA